VARTSHAAATRALLGPDPALDALVALAGPLQLRPRDPDGHLGSLVHAIVFQQLAGAAATAIHGRVRALIDGPLTAEAILGVDDTALRGAGLSAAKLASLRDLAEKVVDGSVALDRLSRMPDLEVVAQLSSVRGIGRWTAEMFLLFELRRLDIWPVGDLAVRAGYALAWGMGEPPTPKVLDEIGERYRPYRSIVARYCYAAIHLQRAGVAVGLGLSPPPH
jgi:DNA-3-methyladenine glycosylase II